MHSDIYNVGGQLASQTALQYTDHNIHTYFSCEFENKQKEKKSVSRWMSTDGYTHG